MKNKIKLKEKELPSKFFFAPINTGFTHYGAPTRELIDFHRLRSGESIGISYVGNVAIGNKYVTNENTLYPGTSTDLWRELVKAIEGSGSVSGAQVACSDSPIPDRKKIKSRDLDELINVKKEEMSNLSTEDIDNMLLDFKLSIKFLIKVGFSVIQIHAAHGYFISKLLNPLINVRKDKYGLDREFFLFDLIRTIKSENSEVIIDVRISIRDGMGSEEEEREVKDELIDKLVKEKIDIISFSNGFYEVDRTEIYPPKKKGHCSNMKFVIPFCSKYPNQVWNIAGNIWDLSLLDFKFHNLTFSVGRSLIADPRFIEKYFKNKVSDIKECKRIGKCHHFTHGVSTIKCPQSDDLN